MNNFSIEVPLNSLSFGQIGFNILRELFNRNIKPNVFVIGPQDLKAFIIPPGFIEWLNECQYKAQTEFSENEPFLSLWHIQGSHKRLSNVRNVLWTAHETDRITDTEVNILNKWDKVLVTSNYSKNVFSQRLSNCDWCPNFFDDLHFFKTNRQYRNSGDVTTFGLFGKLEHRKQSLNILISWANLYANNPKFRLNCFLYNPFLPPEVQSNQINQVFRGQKPWNIELFPFQETNVEYNNAVNAIDVDITGLSAAEGWNLPTFNALCLGKQAVVLNAHAHKDFANEENSILVEPFSTQEIYDNQFFQKGYLFNQGNMAAWTLQDAQQAILKATQVAKIPNLNGEKLKEKFSLKNTVDILLSNL